jgi:hypothetical protein
MTSNDAQDAAATIRGDLGAAILGPDNVAIGAQNPVRHKLIREVCPT